MTLPFSVLCVASLLLATLVACTPPGAGGGDKQALDDAGGCEPGASGSALGPEPVWPPIAEDEIRSAPPSLCAWASSADVIVWGVLTDVRFVEQPAVQRLTGGGWTLVDAPCERFDSNYAMKLDLVVEDVIAGGGVSVGQTLTAHIGSRHRNELEPRPTLGDDGATTWESRGAIDGNTPWEIGEPIGLVLRDLSSVDAVDDTTGAALSFDGYSVMGEPVFVADCAGRVVFQPHRQALEGGPPVGASGRSIEELVHEVSMCTDDEDEDAQHRRFLMQHDWGAGASGAESPAGYIAAHCAGTVTYDAGPGDASAP